MARGREKAAVQTAPVEGPWELPEGWRWADLGELLGGRSKSVTPSKFPNEIFELYSVPSFNSRSPEILAGAEIGSSKQAVTQGDVLLCKINPRINRAWVVGSPRGYPQIASTEWIRFACRKDIDPHFLCHYLSTEALRSYLAMNASGVGGSLMRVKTATLNGYPIPIPPLETQRRIVARIDELFSELDDGETALARAREDLEVYRKALLKAAVTGELTADWRAANPCTETGEQLLQRILAERRARWEADPKNKGKRYKEPAAPDTSGLPELPEGWAWMNLDQLAVADPRNGLSLKEASTPTQTRALRLDALGQSLVDWTKYRYLPKAWSEVSQYALTTGDFLVSRANGSPHLVGKGAICLEPPGDMIFPDTIIRYPLGNRFTRSQWIQFAWSSPILRAQIIRRAKTTAGILKISQDDIRSIALPMPPTAESEIAVEMLTAHLEQTEAQSSAIAGSKKSIASLRQSILVAAFKGELVQ